MLDSRGLLASFSFRQPVAPCEALLYLNIGIVLLVELVKHLGTFINNLTLCLSPSLFTLLGP